MHKNDHNAQKLTKCTKSKWQVLHETKIMKQKQRHTDFFETFQWLTDTSWKLNHVRLTNDEKYR